jgi:hypothetical protein
VLALLDADESVGGSVYDEMLGGGSQEILIAKAGAPADAADLGHRPLGLPPRAINPF